MDRIKNISMDRTNNIPEQTKHISKNTPTEIINENSCDKIYTIHDIYALPEGHRAEIIDGQIYYMSPPSWTHQKM